MGTSEQAATCGECAALRGRLREVERLVAEAVEGHQKQADRLQAVTALLAGDVSAATTAKRLLAVFSVAWHREYGGAPYKHSYPKAMGQAKHLVKHFTAEDLEARIERYVVSTDPFIVRAHHSFDVFVVMVNQFGVRPAATAGVPGCRHDPPCVDDVAHTRRITQDLKG